MFCCGEILLPNELKPDAGIARFVFDQLKLILYAQRHNCTEPQRGQARTQNEFSHSSNAAAWLDIRHINLFLLLFLSQLNAKKYPTMHNDPAVN